MRQRKLTPANATLLMLGVGIVALMGLPGFGRYHPPEGPIAGIVRTPDGAAVPSAEVALFADDGPGLVQRTHTDARGYFAFHQAPRRFHLFARAGAVPGTVGTWVLSREPAPAKEVELVLGRGAPVTVQVSDSQGDPLAGVEVRAYDAAGEPTVVARLETDATGAVSFLAPLRCHLAILGRDELASVWYLAESIPEEGRSFAVTLPPAVEIAGRAVDELGKPLMGVVVTAWQRETEERWQSYTRTDANGHFVLRTAGGNSLLRAVDPALRHLSTEVVWNADDARSAELVLERGSRLELTCLAGDDAVPSRVWVWSREAHAWGWGARNDALGRLRTVASAEYGIVAEPLARGRSQVQEWRRLEDGAQLDLVWPADR